jgi:hypothetical protein
MEIKEGLIVRKMLDIYKEVPAIGKNNESTGSFKFNYRGIEDVYNKLSEIFVKHEVFTIPEVVKSELYVRETDKGVTLHRVSEINFNFVASDGSFITSTIVGEGMDNGDKSTSKSISIAHKYCLFTMFMIPTDEVIDPDQDQYKVKKQEKTEAPAKKFGGSAFSSTIKKREPVTSESVKKEQPKETVKAQENEEENPFINEIKHSVNGTIVSKKPEEKGEEDDIPSDFDV